MNTSIEAKLDVFSRRSIYMEKNPYITEAQRSQWSSDILFTQEERSTLRDFFSELLEQYTASYQEDMDVVNEALATGVIREDDDIRDIFFKKDGNIRKDLFEADGLNLKQFLFRPETTFSEKDENKLGEAIKKYRREKGDTGFWGDLFSSKKKLNNIFKHAVEIIWDVLNSKLDEDTDMTMFDLLIQEAVEELDYDEMMCESLYDECTSKSLKSIKSFKSFLEDMIE